MDKKENRIKIRLFGELKLGTRNFILFTKKELMRGGISMIADLLEAIFGIRHKEPWASYINERIPNLWDYIIQIFKEYLGINIEICGFCRYYNNEFSRGCDDFGHASCGFDDSCEKWSLKEISTGKK